MKKLFFLFLFGGSQLECFSQEVSYEDVIEGQSIHLTKSIIATLTSSQFEGRNINQPQIQRSILYLESLFRAFNIKTYFDSYRVSYKIKDSTYGFNLVGLYRGNLRKKSAILITANYDNLGLTKDRKNADTIYKGANDNATGVSAVIQLALFFNKIKPRENIIFALTSGKHQNMIGAGFLADTIQKYGLLEVKYVINLEMLGRPMPDMKNNLIGIQDSSHNIISLLNESIGTDFIANATGDEFKEGSEHTPFYNVLKVPTVTLTSFNFNNDKNYLSPKDDINNIDIDYLHRTTARITLGLHSLISQNKIISFELRKKND